EIRVTAALKYFLHDVGHCLVLEDFAILPQRQEPEPGPDHGGIGRQHLLRTAADEMTHPPVNVALRGRVGQVDLYMHGLVDEGGCGDRGVLADHVQPVLEGARDRLLPFETFQQEFILAERCVDPKRPAVLRVFRHYREEIRSGESACPTTAESSSAGWAFAGFRGAGLFACPVFGTRLMSTSR